MCVVIFLFFLEGQGLKSLLHFFIHFFCGVAVQFEVPSFSNTISLSLAFLSFQSLFIFMLKCCSTVLNHQRANTAVVMLSS